MLIGATTNYPLLDILWTMLEIFILIVWIFILFSIIFDIFRSHDIGGWSKAFWLLFILVIPLIGVLVYLIARGGGMHERSAQQAKAQDDAFKAYVKQTAESGTSADQLSKLADLHSKGLLSDAEFQAEKAKVIQS